MVLVPLLIAILAAFMRFSTLGKQVRAAANNPDAARLCGISINRVQALCWALAGGLAAVSAVLQAPTQATFNVASLGPELLMLALGAAAFGAFVSLPAALAGGLLLGLVGQITSAVASNATQAQLAVFVTILIVILIRGRAISRGRRCECRKGCGATPWCGASGCGWAGSVSRLRWPCPWCRTSEAKDTASCWCWSSSTPSSGWRSPCSWAGPVR
jgi:ABC-type uncharacterized transport system permease subunit